MSLVGQNELDKKDQVMKNSNQHNVVGLRPDDFDLSIIKDDKPTIAEIKEHTLKQIDRSRQGLFFVQTVNKWIEGAKLRPVPKMLFGEFWFEGELCILFADTNLGKSILAVQIGDSISKGNPIHGFSLEATRQKVLYFDFELSDKQFEARYSVNYNNHYSFSDSFHRAEIDAEADLQEGYNFESYLNNSLEQSIIKTSAKVLIIDNITYLKSQTEKAKDALPLMKHLKTLKSKYGLSILALAHTPKRDLSKPITKNDLQGSKMLINFCDSAFTIGENHSDKTVRYLKQIKARNVEIKFDLDNVCRCQVEKPSNFLRFEFLGYSTEQEHLKVFSENDKEQRIDEAIEMKGRGISNTDIAKHFGVSEGAVRKWLKKKLDIETPNPKT